MSEIEIYQIVSGFAVMILVWLAKYGFDQLMKKLDELIKATRENNAEIMVLQNEVENHEQLFKTHDKRLNSHSKSIRDLEKKVG